MEGSGLAILPVNRLGARLDSQKPGQEEPFNEGLEGLLDPGMLHPNPALSDWTMENGYSSVSPQFENFALILRICETDRSSEFELFTSQS